MTEKKYTFGKHHHKEKEEKEKEKKEKLPKYLSRAKRKHDKRVVGYLLILIIAIFTIGIVYYINTQPLPEKPESTSKHIQENITKNQTINETEEEKEVCDDACYFNKALSEKDFTECLKIEDETTKQNCLRIFANESLDACELIKDYEIKKECITRIAKEREDTLLCTKLKENDSRACIENINPCYFLEEEERAICNARIKDDVSYCNGILSCVFKFAQEKEDKEACLELTDKKERKICEMLFDEFSCDSLIYKSEKEYCYSKYSMLKNDTAYCFGLEEGIYKTECVKFFAKERRKPSICEYLSFNDKWDCYTEYAITFNQPEVCNSISKYAPVSKSNCYSKVAWENLNPEACSYLSKEMDKPSYYCYTDVFERVKNSTTLEINPEFCDGIPENTWRDKCYMWSAISTNQPDICQMISDESSKRICYQKFEE